MTDIFPQLVERYTNLVSLFFRNTPGVSTYRVVAAGSLDDAYGNANGVGGAGPVILFEVRQGATYRSRSIRSKRWGLIDESTRGQTRAVYDPDDFYDPVNTVAPSDAQIAFLRVQVTTVASGGTFGSLGPIVPLPNREFHGTPHPLLTLAGTAPNVGGAAGELPPPGSMHIRIPNYGDALTIINNDATAALLVSTGPGLPLAQVEPGAHLSHDSGTTDSLLIAANAANPNFSIVVATGQGQR